ncbi:hypothetical protein E3Q02_01872 [Wallemia mellicola]|uniref:Uncharacterized protein n=1 Tax=Wallemia mellicola TaxID=1708541 RepID=A0AB38N1I2_9BASI|nr:hypothetical protein E3Q02_01872 [Wallemia mellicola]
MSILNAAKSLVGIEEQRTLTVQSSQSRIGIPVSRNVWWKAEILRENFLQSTHSQLEQEENSEDDYAQLELLSKFLKYVATSDPDEQSLYVLQASLVHFHQVHLTNIDVHNLTAKLDADLRKLVLSAYFKSKASLEAANLETPKSPAAALIEQSLQGNANVYALFGGQGANEVYFDELQNLFDIYQPYVEDFLAQSSKTLVELAKDATNNGSVHFSQSIDVINWLRNGDKRPSVAYLASIPLSLPLIGLTQLVQYLAFASACSLSPGKLRENIKGATGHSQGVISAVVAAASDSYQEFTNNALKALKVLFYIGLRGQETFPTLSIEPALIEDSIEGGEGEPTPMLSVSGLSLSVLESFVNKTNAHLADSSKISVRLLNGPKNFIVTGPPRSLYGLVTNLRKVRAPTGLDQSKVPFSKRKAVFNARFLVVGVPYHSSYLESATPKVINDDLANEELWTPSDLKLAVYHTETGQDLRELSSGLTKSLVSQIFTQPIHWTKATDFPTSATHAIDFGPGGMSGIGPLTQRNWEGRGIRVLIPGANGKTGSEIYDSSLIKEEKWNEKFQPALVKTKDGKIHLDTPFSRLLGKPPLMVAGMTPSTVKGGFVSAVLNAGYHIELAGGGHYNAKMLRAKVAEIQDNVQPGNGLTLNALYINQRQFTFQFPLWQQMRQEGLPIEGFCVAAGIPSSEKATEMITALKESGIKHVAFKPGSVEGIRQVVNIASANPSFPIIMQWTGGRAGGHHSCEDVHQPIIQTYASIRQHSNISLVAGSGFGAAEDFWPYLTGDWSLEFGLQPMPFDGALFASRVMVAKEAHTSASVKQLIVDAPGVDDKDWENTYDKETGGILTVRSELGEPIHKIATRGVKLWREFDDTVFNLPREKRGPWLDSKRDYVIDRLNKDFQKPWFGEKADGTVVSDIGDMTYEEVTKRMVKLLYVGHQSRWIDLSLRNLVGDWLRRVEERFSAVDGTEKISILQSYSELDQPADFINRFFDEYTGAKEQLLAAEDKAYFLNITQRPGQKPVPFIPVLDNSFEVWFKKDSLWQAEDIDAVVDQDPQRVCILQGPVAAKHSTKVDEPIKELLGGIEEQLVKKLLERRYNGDASKVPEVDYIGAQPVNESSTQLESYKIISTTEQDKQTYQISDRLPPTEEWLESLAGSQVGWFRALVTTPIVVQGKGYTTNPMKKLLAPRRGQKVVIDLKNGQPIGAEFYGGIRSAGSSDPSFQAVKISYNESAGRITLVLSEERRGESVPLTFEYEYKPAIGYAPIHEVMEGRNQRIKDFYWQLWELGAPTQLNVRDTFTGPPVTIDAATVEKFCAIIGNDGEAFKSNRTDEVQAPMDFAIVTGWQAIMKAIFPKEIDGDLLKLVHLSNGFKLVSGARPIAVGDVCSAEAKIVSIVNSDSGKTVMVKGFVMRDGKPAIEVSSSFLYRGKFEDYENTFEIIDESQYRVELKSDSDVALLRSKEWFQWDDESKPLTVGTSLIFDVQSELHYGNATSYKSLNVSGRANIRNQLKELVPVGTVELESGLTKGNPVIEYLRRNGKVISGTTLFENDGYSLTKSSNPSLYVSPFSNESYSKISGDFNPIHVNPYFADLGNLPGTIAHGMYGSAATRKYVETVAADNVPSRVLSYQVTFVGMVLPGDTLEVKLRHIGMDDGAKIISVDTVNQDGDKVISGQALVAQPTTTYVFTGQGSQEQGMGMALYESSEAARKVWNAADDHLGEVYGFSIIDIVKNNPKAKTIHFGGLKGQAIRQRYMDLRYDTTDKEGNVKTLPLFPDITVRTSDYTFQAPNGLLFATQFAQIALVVTEKAAFEDMRSKGLVQSNCAFAGHSLGEYASLASIADVLPISSLTDVVFYRGLTMQRAVERDAFGRSQFRMMAVNPSRIGKTFDESILREIVDSVSRRTQLLLQIVNFNVDGQQYVCAGHLQALETLTNTLNFMKVKKIDISALLKQLSVEQVKAHLDEIIDECFGTAKAKADKEGGFLTLERGFATIPLPGIDVPFHSRYLWAGVMPFRTYLSQKIDAKDLNPDMLIGKYIPNLVAKPFEISKPYIEMIYNQTNSPRLEKVLSGWDSEKWSAPENRQVLAYTTLVELLAYQFASPVRWIETQDLFFTHYNFERYVEIGPSPTLSGMATRTQKLKYEGLDTAQAITRTILCHAKNQKEIYYEIEDEVEEAAAPAEESAPAPTPAAPVPTPAAAAPAPAPSAGGAPADIPDEPLKATDTLRIIIAQKLKKGVSEVQLGKSIKDLVGGKSTLQNEILGDLQTEFGNAPEKGEELPLDELGSALNVGYSGSLGKFTAGLVSRMVGSKMPGGFNLSSVKTHLSKTWGLGPQRQEAALLFAVTMEPAKRLGSEPEAKQWVDSIAHAYAGQAGITLTTASAGGAGGGAAAGGVTISSEELDKFRAEQNEFASHQVDAYMRYLNRDPRAGHRLHEQEKQNAAALQDRLDAIAREHGDAYINGVMSSFDPLKARTFDSSWNWARQDALAMFYDIIFGRLTTVDRDITSRCLNIISRADPTLIDYMSYYIGNVNVELGPTYKLAKELGEQLLENCREAVKEGEGPKYKDVTFPTAPHTEVTAKGDIVYSEINREDVRKLEHYVKEMAAGGKISTQNVNLDKVQSDVEKLYELVKSQPQISETHKTSIKSLYDEVLRSLGRPASIQAPPPRTRRSSSQFLRPEVSENATVHDDKLPFLHLKRKVGTNWQYSTKLTEIYLDILTEIATSGTTFKDKNALLTGVGKGSIGVEIVKGLIAGGARVVITTSRYSRATVEYYQAVYHECGSRGSSLTVVPFNQGSKQDVEQLVEYIYSTLGMDLDYVLPFAALPENGREIDGLDDKSELAHRIMLVNVLRLLGAVKAKKAARNFVTRPTQVVLPLSPNHGLFGNDGLYSESKISLETLFNRWSSESWGDYLCLAGAVIGWTRGTGLMSATNIVAEGVENHGVRTFSSKEMAFNILGLMHPLLFDITQVEPIWADLNGGMDRLPDLAQISTKLRQDLQADAARRRAISADNSADFATVNGVEAEGLYKEVKVAPRANFKYGFPDLSKPEVFGDLGKLEGLIDLDKVVVVSGFAEVGPWGSARTRWEMEARGEFTIEGCIEMAWMMGFIKHFDGRLKSGQLYVGWVDSKSGDPVDDKDVKPRYEKPILEHTGIRLIEPELFKGYDPKRKGFNQEIELNHDLEPIEVSDADAEKFRNEHGDKVDIWQSESGEWSVKLKRGARVLVPKAFHFNRLVAGQLPTGWDAGRYGIPADIAAQIDRTALWSLVAVTEALVNSGITDPYEIYKYVHPSEVGTSLGSGMGGMEALSAMFKDRREEKDVQMDILQETFINTVAGWVNLLLMSSSGPIKIPVGACATALQSLDIACDTLLTGKAKVMIAGGFDDFSEEGSYEFANMKATSNSETEFANGREPNEMSRPTTTTRAGFMESQGTGVQVLMTASTAIKMGSPIRGVIGFTSTSSDKAGRSIPAPGKGLLSVGREIHSDVPIPTLDINYRSRQMQFRRKQVSEWLDNELELLSEEFAAIEKSGGKVDEATIKARTSFLEEEAERQEKQALASFGMLEGTDARIAPLRRALAVWGLKADDIGLCTFHGTSTKANDKNESETYNELFKHLGRTEGNACPVIAQKWLTGHPKGGAAAWMFNGAVQAINDAIIPGNRNADNISAEMQAFKYLVYLSKSIKVDAIKCGILTSFGFGQVGGSCLIVHPAYLYAALSQESLEQYAKLRADRERDSYKKLNAHMIHNNLVQIKETPPFASETEIPVLLNPLARTENDNKGSYSFPKKLNEKLSYKTGNAGVASEMLKSVDGVQGVGTDAVLISAVPVSNPTFVERNFTTGEVAYCEKQPDSKASFAARWAAKEAVFKALNTKGKGAAASMKEIEVVSSETGPTVKLHGDAAKAANERSVKEFKLSLSHSEDVAIALAFAQ